MKYLVVYGDTYLTDYGVGWHRWITERSEAREFEELVIAQAVAELVGGKVCIESCMPI